MSQTQEIVWVRTFRPYQPIPDLATDSRNNVIVCAFPLLRKYNSDGELLWEREINFGNGGALRVDVDRGDSIVVGGCNYIYDDTTWFIMKCSPTGESLWKRVFVFPRLPESLPWFSDIAIDNQNSILLTGFVPGTYSSKWLTYKLFPDGEIKWRKIFTSNWGPDMGTRVCADDSLNVIVCGVRGVYPVSRSWYPQVFKYSQFGDSLWAVCYFDSFPGNHVVGELTADRWGNVILPGVRAGTPFLFKYDQLGNTLWMWFDTISCQIHSCVTDTGGNIYTAGARKLPDTIIMEVRKFLPSGESLWVFSYPLGPRYAIESFWFEIDLDSEGNILVAANKDTFVYVLKITEHPGIIEDKTEKMNWDFISSTIITSKRNSKINLPSSITLVSIYNIAGKLIRKIRTSDGKTPILNSRDIQFFPEGIYFIKTEGKKKEIIKVILLN